MTKTIEYSVTLANGAKGMVSCTFDLSNLTEEDIIQYAMQAIVIQKQVRDRKCNTFAEVKKSTVVSKPGTRAVSLATFEIVELLRKCGVADAIAVNFAKLRGKDEDAMKFIKRLEEMLGALGVTVDLMSKLEESE